MKFENKKWVLNVALAGALCLGVASVAKADDATASAAAPTFSALAQETGVQKFGTAGAGNSFNMGLENVRVGATYGIDALDTLTVQTSFAANFANAFTLLDAYDVHTLSDINPGLALKVGQFKTDFGEIGYSTPDQLIRTQYSGILGAASPNNVANEGNSWLVGVEADQNYKDLTIQVAAVQSQAIAFTSGTKVDYVGRVQWKGTDVTLGVSDYLASTANNVNSLGANASVNIDVLQLDLEAIFGGNATNGYNATLSAKPVAGFQPAAWYEFNTSSAGTAGADDLGAGLNFTLAAKTRLALDVDFTGPSTGDILSVNTETAQLQEVF